MKVAKLNYEMANDNGNSKQKAIINDEYFLQPNVHTKILQPNIPGVKPLDLAVEQILDNLVINVMSNSLKQANHGNYLIGTASLADNKKQPKAMRAGKDLKSDSDLPLINTLGLIAGKAVKDVYQSKGELPNRIEVKVDMVTALPVSEIAHDFKNREKFRNKFTEHEHQVVVYITQTVAVKVDIKFDFVFVIEEGVTALFSIMGNKGRTTKLIEALKEQNDSSLVADIDLKKLMDMTILHVEPGDGTTELCITKGYNYLEQYALGLSVGAAYAMDEAREVFQKEENMNIARQKFSEFVEQPEKHPEYHQIAKGYVDQTVGTLVEQLMDAIKGQFERTYNEIDLVLAYGGGSILIKEVMLPEIKEHLSHIKRPVLVLWVPKDYAVTMNVDGMNQIFKNGMFKKLKEQASATQK
ncbi:ParM/StbA family protein [Bacillus sp. FJAT-29937]|uniref:ParM/StbA family protein n=1 Tax=Bacillus sp. FJAT-29937 TaxID=1720553 RepID=UPI000833161D|nr:ParM/StbA family protein [Bacillus sp. FJAT-29937]